LQYYGTAGAGAAMAFWNGAENRQLLQLRFALTLLLWTEIKKYSSSKYHCLSFFPSPPGLRNYNLIDAMNPVLAQNFFRLRTPTMPMGI